MTIPKRTVSFSNDETGTDWRLVTAKELAALEARKPQVPAEVIERARKALDLTTRDNSALAVIVERGQALSALLAAVEAAPEVATPDFASMSADDLRAWLDERGRLYEGRATGEEVRFHAWFDGGGAVGAGSGSTREAALLALCQKVAAKEAS